MNLVVTTNLDSIVDAQRHAEEAEHAIIEGVFTRIVNREIEGPDPPWHSLHRASYETDALCRHRAEVVPRLRAIAEGRRGECEPSRVFAAVMLAEVDRIVGFRALLSLLKSDDPITLFQVMEELGWLWFVSEDEPRTRARLVLEPDDLERICRSLDHPNPRVVRAAIRLLEKFKPPGVFDHVLLPRIDDPVFGELIQLAVAGEGRETTLLQRAFDSLKNPGRSVEDDHSLKLLDRFAGSDDPRNASLALNMMETLHEGDRVLPEERRSLNHYRDRYAYRAALRASYPEELVRATAQVERIVSAGIIDRAAGDKALVPLRDSKEGNWYHESYWGAKMAFRAAEIWLAFDTECVDVPPPHDDLIRNLAGISLGIFQPEAVFQDRDASIDRGDDYRVQFVHRGRLYRFYVPHCGDWYDAGSVFEAANAALAHTDEPRRFVDISDRESQCATIVFCDPVMLEPIAPDLGLEPRVPTAPDVRRVSCLGDSAHDRLWNQVRDLVGDEGRSMSIRALARWRKPSSQETALHLAIGKGRLDMVLALIAAGADVNARTNGSEETLLHQALNARPEDRLDLVDTLLYADADVNAAGKWGRTALHRAAESGDRAIAARLLDYGADHRACETSRGHTPLHYALRNGHTETVMLLLDRGAEVNEVNE